METTKTNIVSIKNISISNKNYDQLIELYNYLNYIIIIII